MRVKKNTNKMGEDICNIQPHTHTHTQNFIQNIFLNFINQ